MTLFLILSAAVFVAAFIQGAIGIGFALIVAPVFGILAPEYLPVTLLILMLPLNFHIAWRERGDIDRLGTGWITLGRFFGTFAGLWMLAALSGRHLGLAVGWFTVIAAAVAAKSPNCGARSVMLPAFRSLFRSESASPTRCTRPTGCCARSPVSPTPIRALWCALTVCC